MTAPLEHFPEDFWETTNGMINGRYKFDSICWGCFQIANQKSTPWVYISFRIHARDSHAGDPCLLPWGWAAVPSHPPRTDLCLCQRSPGVHSSSKYLCGIRKHSSIYSFAWEVVLHTVQYVVLHTVPGRFSTAITGSPRKHEKGGKQNRAAEGLNQPCFFFFLLIWGRMGSLKACTNRSDKL